MAQFPVFAAGTYDKILPNIEKGILTYPSYIYIRDKKTYAFVDEDLSINEIVGNNPELVISVEELPSIEEANSKAIYIYNNILYTFDGTNFKPMYQDVSSDLEKINSDLEVLSGKVTTLEESSHPPIQWIVL